MSKPVAFMNPTALEYKQRATDFMHNDSLYPKNSNWIPLYTHPVKQLSDEEIWEVINRTAWVGTEEEIRFKIANAIIKEITE